MAVPEVLRSGDHARDRGVAAGGGGATDARAAAGSVGRRTWRDRTTSGGDGRHGIHWAPHWRGGSTMERLAEVAREGLRTDIPAFDAGDTVRVMVRVREGDKERLQAFEGVVIAKRGGGDQRELHRPEGLGRRRRRAHLPDPQPHDRLGRAGAPRPGPPRQAVLPPRAERQGRAHPGEARELSRMAASAPRWTANGRSGRGAAAGRRG